MACRLSGREAKDLLDEYVRLWDPARDGSSSGKPKSRRQLSRERGREASWRDNPKPDLRLRPRSCGQLLAYVDLVGGCFSSVGIECADGAFIEPDMQVLKSFRGAGIVAFREDQADPWESYFELTSVGRRFLRLLPNGDTR